MMYTIIDITIPVGTTYVPLLVIFLLDRIVVFARVYFGERNISAKTLIDRKFIL